jgi:hypothetical protein
MSSKASSNIATNNPVNGPAARHLWVPRLFSAAATADKKIQRLAL